MSLALVVALFLVWFAHSTGYRQGLEAAPAHYAFKSEELAAEQAFLASAADAYDPEVETCKEILTAWRGGGRIDLPHSGAYDR